MSRSREWLRQFREAKAKSSRGDCQIGEKLGADGWPTGQSFYLSQEAREMHMQVLGLTRRGKSKAIEALLKDYIEKHKGGVLLLDPAGDFYYEMVRFCASKELETRVLLLDPGEDYILGFNPLTDYTEREDPTKSTLNAFNKVYGVKDFYQTKRLGRWARNTFYALIDNELNLTEGSLLLNPYENQYRKAVTNNIKKEDIKRDFEMLIKTRAGELINLIESTSNWFNPFVDENKLKWIFGQRNTVIDIEKAYKERKIILVNLSQGVVNQEERRIIGTMLLYAFTYCAFGKREEERVPFYAIVDECHQFINPDILEIVRMAAKFKFFLTLIHQDLSDLEEDRNLYESVLNNAQTKIIFGGLSAKGLERILKDVMSRRLNPTRFNRDRLSNPAWRLNQLIDEMHNLDPHTCLVSPFLEEPQKVRIKDLPPTTVSQERLRKFKEHIFNNSGCYSHFEDVKEEIEQRRDKFDQLAQEAEWQNISDPKTFRHQRKSPKKKAEK